MNAKDLKEMEFDTFYCKVDLGEVCTKLINDYNIPKEDIAAVSPSSGLGIPGTTLYRRSRAAVETVVSLIIAGMIDTPLFYVGDKMLGNEVGVIGKGAVATLVGLTTTLFVHYHAMQAKIPDDSNEFERSGMFPEEEYESFLKLANKYPEQVYSILEERLKDVVVKKRTDNQIYQETRAEIAKGFAEF